MHELSVMESVLGIALDSARKAGATRVLSVGLVVSAASDMEDEWLRRYFGYASAGTLAEGASLRVERVPARLSCRGCGAEFDAGREALSGAICPACGSEAVRLVGPTYFVKDLAASVPPS